MVPATHDLLHQAFQSISQRRVFAVHAFRDHQKYLLIDRSPSNGSLEHLIDSYHGAGKCMPQLDDVVEG